jgi:predicted nucleotidyltransferase
MRLAADQISAIKAEVRRLLGPEARIWLFGSRAQDATRGGDIDLYVETDQVLANRARTASQLSARIQLRLGDQRIDVVLVDPQTRAQPIHAAAKETGVAL